MAKTNRKNRHPRKAKVTIPVAPMPSAAEVCFQQATDNITEQKCSDFMAVLFDPSRSKQTESVRRQRTEAVMDFAALGWAYYSYRKFSGGGEK
jgi:hypothetical protein